MCVSTRDETRLLVPIRWDCATGTLYYRGPSEPERTMDPKARFSIPTPESGMSYCVPLPQ